MTRPVTLLVLAWNRWELTRRCLESLRRTDIGDAEVLVVDNGSTDGTAAELRALDWLRVLSLPENLGFVRGNNAGIAATAPDRDVVLLNNDLVFTQHDWLARLRACAHRAPDHGIVGCRLILPDGRLLHAGTFILPDTMWGQQIGALEPDLGQYVSDREVQGIVFACAYLRREVLDAIGGLSTDYVSYFEDTDYCLRAAKAGFKTIVCGGVTLVHDEHGSTATDASGRAEMFERSRAVFGRTWAADLQARYRQEILWQSIIGVPTGYAMSCREIVRALDGCGVRVAYRYLYGPGTVFAKPEPDESGDYLLDVMRSRSLASPPRAAVVYGQGDAFKRNEGRIKIGFTMLEVDGFPKEWVRQANGMDEVWVPSELNRVGMLESGVRSPVHVIPLGVDCDRFHPTAAAVPNPMGDFVFLSTFEWGERKAPELLLTAFNDAFSAREPVRLLCKVMNSDAGVDVIEEVRRLGLRESGGRISFLFNLEFPHNELCSLYRSADCFVSPSRGEGWNMPLTEAMACGLPVIATDWGPHREYLHAGIGYPLRSRGNVAATAKCPYYRGRSWADPDPEHLRHLLRHVFEHRDEAKHKGLLAAAEMRRRWAWGHTALRIRERLEQIGH